MRTANNPVGPPAGLFVRPFSRWMERLASKPVLGLLAAGMALLAGTVPLRADEIPVGCTGSALGINLFTDTRDVHVGDTIRYSVTIFNGLPGSPRVACDATGIQAAVVTPDGKTNDITSLLVRRTLSNQQNDFYTNVVAYVVAPTFTTIDPMGHAVVDHFAVPAGLDGLNYADQDKGYAATGPGTPSSTPSRRRPACLSPAPVASSPSPLRRPSARTGSTASW